MRTLAIALAVACVSGHAPAQSAPARAHSTTNPGRRLLLLATGESADLSQHYLRTLCELLSNDPRQPYSRVAIYRTEKRDVSPEAIVDEVFGDPATRGTYEQHIIDNHARNKRFSICLDKAASSNGSTAIDILEIESTTLSTATFTKDRVPSGAQDLPKFESQRNDRAAHFRDTAKLLGLRFLIKYEQPAFDVIETLVANAAKIRDEDKAKGAMRQADHVLSERLKPWVQPNELTWTIVWGGPCAPGAERAFDSLSCPATPIASDGQCTLEIVVASKRSPQITVRRMAHCSLRSKAIPLVVESYAPVEQGLKDTPSTIKTWHWLAGATLATSVASATFYGAALVSHGSFARARDRYKSLPAGADRETELSRYNAVVRAGDTVDRFQRLSLMGAAWTLAGLAATLIVYGSSDPQTSIGALEF